MNKTLFFMGMMLAGMLTACSSDEAAVDTAPQQLDLTNSTVGIQLNSAVNAYGQQLTRSTVDSDPQGNFKLKGIRIFGLATKQLRNGRNFPIDWQQRGISRTGVNSYSVWVDNVEVNTRDSVLADGKHITMLDWADGLMRYYPIGNGHAYSFFGVYPAPQDLHYESNSIYGTIPMDYGATDVIWGVADRQLASPQGADTLAYCAKYFRQTGHQQEIPSMQFKHALMRLHFTYAAGDDGTGNTEEAKKLRIVGIQVHKVPTTGKLYIASRDGQHTAGSIECEWSDPSKLATIALEDSDGVHRLEKMYWVTDGEKTVGQKIMVPVPPTNDYYTMTLQLADREGRVYEDAYGMEIPITLKDGFKFQAGHSYKVALKIYPIEWLKLGAKLEGWVEDEGMIEDASQEIN